MVATIPYQNNKNKTVRLELPGRVFLSRGPLEVPLAQSHFLEVRMDNDAIMVLSMHWINGKRAYVLIRGLVAPQILEVIEHNAEKSLRNSRHPAYSKTAQVKFGGGLFSANSLARAPLKGRFRFKIRQPRVEFSPAVEQLTSFSPLRIKEIRLVERDEAYKNATTWRPQFQMWW